MARYKYVAVNQQGQLQHAIIDADNLVDLERYLEGLSLDLIAAKEVNTSLFKNKKVTRYALINFCFQMEQLINAGVPIIEALKDLYTSMENCYLKDVLASLVERIEEGKTLSQAMRIYPEVFDNIFVTLVTVGEESGNIGKVLYDMGETLKWLDELISHGKKILIYPSIVSIIIFAVISFLMIYLVPKLIPFIQELGGTLPLHTQLLIAVSDFFIAYWYIIFSSPFILFFGIQLGIKYSHTFAYYIDKIKLKVWLFGDLLFKIKIARFANYFALLYASGITVLEALRICEDLMDNRVLSAAILQAKTTINEGQTISNSFSQTALFPPLVIRMLRVGENTGELDKALLNIRYFYNRSVREGIDKVEPVIEPILTVVLGAILGWVMLSVLGPVYDVISTI